MQHPLERIPVGELRRWQLPSAAVSLACIAGVVVLLPGADSGALLNLVEAGSVSHAAALSAEWAPIARVSAAYVVGLDFLMNPAYMNVLAIAVVWSGRRFESPRIRGLATVLAWLAWSVVVTNVAENIGLYLALIGETFDPWPSVTAAAHYWAGAVIASCAIFSVAGLVGTRHR